MPFQVFGDASVSAALGLTPGADQIYKFGKRDGIGNTKWSDIWSGTDEVYPGFLDFGVAEPLDITSDDDGDTLLGAGCRVIRVYGTDANLKAQAIDYLMNGSSGVETAEVWSRVWRMRSVGSADRRTPNLGNIVAKSQAAGNPEMACIPAPTLSNQVNGSTLSSNFTMPAGLIGVMLVTTVGMGDNKVGNIRLIASTISEFDVNPFTVELDIAVNGGPDSLPLAFTVPAGTDVIAQARTITGNSDVFLAYSVYVVTEASIGVATDERQGVRLLKSHIELAAPAIIVAP